MENVKGSELLELLKSGEAVLSEDKKSIKRKSTDELLARKIATNDDRGYYKAIGDDNPDRGCISVCLKWEINKELNIEICVKWGCEEGE